MPKIYQEILYSKTTHFCLISGMAIWWYQKFVVTL